MSQYPPQPQWQPTNPPVPAAQKGWFARHKGLSIVLGLSALIFVVCCGALAASMGGGSDSSTDISTDSSAETGSDSSAATEDSAKKDEKKADKKKEKETAGIGDPARDGKFEFTVTEVETGVSSVGGQFGETADGQFVLVHISVENIGDKPQTFFDSEQIVRDAKGREFSSDSAGVYIDGNDIWLTEVNPGNTAKGVLVYDMPTDAQPSEIELHDSLFSGGVTVSLK